ncbi:MAG: DUF1934 domain-containing protein [Peptostreptococcaceae bacterium]|nr:DUF1934 domain-containing protein [Peptostreptococcaceae bacterium]
MKKVMLKIKGTIKRAGDEPEIIELTTEGKHYKKGGAEYLVYEESEISGMKGATTTLKLKGDKITLTRFGSARMRLEFEKGKRFESEYFTPNGTFELEILTDELYYVFNENIKGNILVRYEMSLKGLGQSNNELNIEIL